MIIKEIYIDGFGVFNGFSLKNLRPGINIIEGENEAGKSTFLHFIRYTLFGYPSRGDKCEPLNGGRHGGRIAAVLRSGKEVTFERHAGSKGGKVQLRYDQNIVEDTSLWNAFLGSASFSLFKNVYGFTLYELAQIDDLKDSGIEDKIFSIGIGVTNVSVGDVESDLAQNAELFYKKGGSAQQIPKLVESIGEKKQVLTDVQEDLDKYNSVMEQLLTVHESIEEGSQELVQKKREHELSANYLKCFDRYTHILQLENEMRELPSVSSCPEDGDQQMKSLEIQQQTTQHAIDALTQNETDGIAQLTNKIEAIYVNNDILKHKKEIIYLNEQLEKYNLTIEEKSNADIEIDNVDQIISQNTNKINAAWSEEKLSGFGNSIQHKDAIDDFEKQLTEIKAKETTLLVRREVKKEQPKGLGRNTIFHLVIIIAIILCVPTFFYSLLFGIAFILIALVTFIFKLISVKKNQSPTSDELEEVQKKITEITNEYQTYLRQLNLHPGLSFAAVKEALSLIDQTQTEIGKKQRIRQNQQARNIYINEFESRAKALDEQSVLTAKLNSYNQFVKDAFRELTSEEKKLEEKESLSKMLESKQREYSRLTSTLTEIENKIEQLISAAGCTNKDSFFEKWRKENLFKQLSTEKKRELITIEQIVGFGKTDEVIDYLKSTDKSSLEWHVQQLSDQVMELDSKLSDLKIQQGALEKEKRDLAAQSAVAEIETELEVEKTKLAHAYKQWLIAKIALKVLTVIKSRYEKEKQPEVIKSSGEVFSEITSGRYKRIQVSLDNKEVIVFDQQERPKKIQQLSRGTKEQLLISLRLGLIEEYEKHNESLPIVLDDVFVNFDSCRTKSTALALEKFAEQRQVIIFTCHPNFADHFSQNVNKVRLVPFQLNGNEISGDLLATGLASN